MGTTIKGFVSKATKGNVSASAYLAANREFLTTGKVGEIAAPVMARLAAGQVYPTPALQELCKLLMGAAISADIARGEASIERAERGEGTTKPYTATVYDDRGAVAVRVTDEGDEKPMTQNFDAINRADEWCERRLVNDGGPGWTAQVRDNRTGKVTEVQRDLAFGRVLKSTGGTVSTGGGGGNGRHAWGMKVSETRPKFSHG